MKLLIILMIKNQSSELELYNTTYEYTIGVEN